jgi:hypothetical protein
VIAKQKTINMIVTVNIFNYIRVVLQIVNTIGAFFPQPLDIDLKPVSSADQLAAIDCPCCTSMDRMHAMRSAHSSVIDRLALIEPRRWTSIKECLP